MGSTKYPILDVGFYLRMMGACADDEECGLISIFDLTGMHVTSMCELGGEHCQAGRQVLQPMSSVEDQEEATIL